MKTKITLFLLVMISAFSTITAKTDKGSANAWKYDIECMENGSAGTYLIKVWSYDSKPNIPAEQMKRNAVHGVIFRGFSGRTGCTSQKPLAKSPTVEEEKADYFKTFFANGGAYLNYASIVSASPEIIKLNKKEYKVGVIVSISKDQLRKDLEAAGIIKGLTSGF